MRAEVTPTVKYTAPSGDQRSFMMGHTSLIQPADQQMIDEIGLYNEYSAASISRKKYGLRNKRNGGAN